jgi:hypothetical protein
MFLLRDNSYFNLVFTDLEDVTCLLTVVVMPYVETCFAGRHVEMLSHTILTLDARPIKLVQAPWNELMVDNQRDAFKLFYTPICVIDLLCSLGHNGTTEPVLCPIRRLLDLLDGSPFFDPCQVCLEFVLFHICFLFNLMLRY